MRPASRMQQANCSPATTNAIPVSQATYKALETVSGSIYTMLGRPKLNRVSCTRCTTRTPNPLWTSWSTCGPRTGYLRRQRSWIWAMGPGRMLLPLIQMGFRVTGYEPDSDYAPAAREALRDVPEAEFRQGGFGDLGERAAYDLIAAVNGPYYFRLEPPVRRDALGHFAREESCSWICRTSCGFSRTTANRLRCV